MLLKLNIYKIIFIVSFDKKKYFSRQIVGYADEEDRHATEAESALQNQKPKRSSGFMPPSPPSPEIHDIVDDNLAADFDGSLSGLGVDIHTASFSMSEALNALPNLSISSSQIFKQEIPSPPSKNEQTNGSPLGENFQNSIQKFCSQDPS